MSSSSSTPDLAGEPPAERREPPPGVLFVLLAFLLLRLIFYVGWGVPGSVLNVDLPSFYLGSYALHEGISPYSEELRNRASATLGQHVFPFLSPPPSLLPLAPLVHWPFKSVAAFVLAANYLAAAVAVFLLFSLAGLGRREVGARCVLAAFFLSSFPVGQSIVHGQLNLLVLVLLCLACMALRRGVGGGAAGVLIALAALLKVFPALLFAPLLTRRRWADLAAGGGVLAAAVAGSAIAIPAATWIDWSERVAPSLRFGHTPLGLFHPAAPFNQSLNGFVSRLFADSEWSSAPWHRPGAIEPVAWVLVGCVLAVSGWALLRDRERTAAAVAIDFGLMLAVLFMVAPLSWDHHLVLVFPAVAVAAVEVLRRRRPRWEQVAVAAGALLVTLPFRFDTPFLTRGLPSLLLSMRLIGTTLVWVVLVRLAAAGRAAVGRPPAAA